MGLVEGGSLSEFLGNALSQLALCVKKMVLCISYSLEELPYFV